MVHCNTAGAVPDAFEERFNVTAWPGLPEPGDRLNEVCPKITGHEIKAAPKPQRRRLPPIVRAAFSARKMQDVVIQFGGRKTITNRLPPDIACRKTLIGSKALTFRIQRGRPNTPQARRMRTHVRCLNLSGIT